MSLKEFLATAKSSIRELFSFRLGDNNQTKKDEKKMFPVNIESAYRFCFSHRVNGPHYRDKKWYDFEPEQIADFLSKIIEKEDKYKIKFDGRKNIEYKTVSQMVDSRNGGACSVKWRGESFQGLFRYMNVQNLRNMFAILTYYKVPITIFGKQYLVEYDNGVDYKAFATDEKFIDQSCYLKELNSGDVKFCKDFLRFKAI